MTVDHEAWAIVGGSIHGRVLLVTNGNSFLEAALALQPNIDLYETTPAKYVNVGTFDLTIFDGFVPPTCQPAISSSSTRHRVLSFWHIWTRNSVSHISAGNDNQNLLNNVDLSSIHVLRASHQLTPASVGATHHHHARNAAVDRGREQEPPHRRARL